MKNNQIPLISVVMLNHNGLEHLKETIPPILGLNYSNYEVLIVDNGSKDGSIEFINKFKKIRLIENGENLGYSKGKNICVNESKGNFILLLDNDILIENMNLLSNILNFYIKCEDVAFIGMLMRDKENVKTKYYGMYSSFYGLNVHKPLIDYNKIQNSSNIIKIGSFNGGAVFFKKEIWNKLEGYDESQPIMLDDFDISSRAYLFGFQNYLFNKDILIHLGKNRDFNKKNFSWKYRYYFSGVASMMFKNYGLSNLLLKFPLFFLTCMILPWVLSFQKRNLYIHFSFIYSYFFFFSNLPAILQKRKEIQSGRVTRKDSFLEIKPPRFD